MNKIIEKWSKIPEWIRWVLCWPIIILAPIVVNILFQVFFSTSAWRTGIEFSNDIHSPKSLGDLWATGINMALGISVIFVAVFYTVPRGQDIVGYFLALLFGISNILGIWGQILTFKSSEITFLQCIGGVILMIVGLGISLYWAYILRVSVKNSDKELDFG